MAKKLFKNQSAQDLIATPKKQLKKVIPAERVGLEDRNKPVKKMRRAILPEGFEESVGQEPAGAYPRKKKMFGQNFLRKQSVVDHMISKVAVDANTTVMEIGIGDGFLTKSILSQTKCKQLLCFEIDQEWIEVVQKTVRDKRLVINHVDILQTNLSMLKDQAPIVLLANLPYQITFPILFRIKENKQFFAEGVVMVQEEVAQKIVAASGRGYSTTSLLLQYHFDWQLMEKVEPAAFVPAPKVFSRLLYFKPKHEVKSIPQEVEFWKFAKLCFKSPRQTIKNNLRSTDYDLEKAAPELLSLRAQQLTMKDLLEVWAKVLVTL